MHFSDHYSAYKNLYGNLLPNRHAQSWLSFAIYFFGYGIITSIGLVSSHAIEIQAQGLAVITHGNLIQAREKAITDAIRNASLKLNASIKSSEIYQQGVLTQDKVELQTSAEVRHFKVISENIQDQQIEVEVLVELMPSYDCAHALTNRYPKTVAVAAFVIDQPKDLTTGRLHHADLTLSQRFTRKLTAHPALTAINASDTNLYPTAQRAPRTYHRQLAITENAEITKTMGTQFVASGLIESMGVVNPDVWFGIGLRRRFALRIFVHDGITGALLLNQQLESTGDWPFSLHKPVGFSTEFWDSDYGMKIETLLDEAVTAISQSVRCQPYMAHVIDAQSHRLRIAAGTASGLKPGDRLALVRRTTQYGLQLEPLIELKRTYVEVKVVQVQPNYSIAELEAFDNSERYAIQRGDLVVRW